MSRRNRVYVARHMRALDAWADRMALAFFHRGGWLLALAGGCFVTIAVLAWRGM